MEKIVKYGALSRANWLPNTCSAKAQLHRKCTLLLDTCSLTFCVILVHFILNPQHPEPQLQFSSPKESHWNTKTPPSSPRKIKLWIFCIHCLQCTCCQCKYTNTANMRQQGWKLNNPVHAYLRFMQFHCTLLNFSWKYCAWGECPRCPLYGSSPKIFSYALFYSLLHMHLFLFTKIKLGTVWKTSRKN